MNPLYPLGPRDMVPRNPKKLSMHLPQKEGVREGEVEERWKGAERGKREVGDENKEEKKNERKMGGNLQNMKRKLQSRH